MEEGEYFPGSEIRVLFLGASLQLEAKVSRFLCVLVGIKEDHEKVDSFGNTSKALSFQTKIQLLIDIGALKKEEKNNYLVFMELRNQFLHNVNASSISECINKYLPNRKKFLLSLCPPVHSKDTEEEQLLEGALVLVIRLQEVTDNLLIKIQEKHREEIWYRFKARTFDTLVDLLKSKKLIDAYPPDRFIDPKEKYYGFEAQTQAEKYVKHVMRELGIKALEMVKAEGYNPTKKENDKGTDDN